MTVRMTVDLAAFLPLMAAAAESVDAVIETRDEDTP